MPIIRETTFRETNDVGQLFDYLREGKHTSPYQPPLGMIPFPRYRAGELVYVPIGADIAEEIRGRVMLITHVSEFDEEEGSFFYDGRYAGEYGFIAKNIVREDCIGRVVRPSPEDAIADDLGGGPGCPREISPLSWLYSMLETGNQPAVREAAIAVHAEDPDPRRLLPDGPGGQEPAQELE
jgi:hypothetical protein